jgi:DNA-directed RNA polymerase subunit RPC12/RpoP
MIYKCTNCGYIGEIEYDELNDEEYCANCGRSYCLIEDLNYEKRIEKNEK